MTSRLTRSGCRLAQAMPIIPPQSCSTSVTSCVKPQMIQQGVQIVDPPAQTILVMLVVGLVGQAAADVVHGDHAIAVAQRLDQTAEVGPPGGVAVDHDHRLAASLVEIVIAQARRSNVRSA